MTSNRDVLILLDADVIIHFYKAERLSLLQELYPGRLRVLDVVLNELLRNPTIKSHVQNLITFQIVKEITFSIANSELFNEFISLEHTITGDGERACLVYCKYYRNIIASSNTRDILPFCTAHDICFLTTLDLLTIATKRGKVTVDEADQMITKITENEGSYLCCKSIQEHQRLHFDNLKLFY